MAQVRLRFGVGVVDDQSMMDLGKVHSFINSFVSSVGEDQSKNKTIDADTDPVRTSNPNCRNNSNSSSALRLVRFDPLQPS